MHISEEAARAFHCPRWDELPSIPLYMDQVMLVLESSLALFTEEKERIVTSTMINNYVKQKLIKAPRAKRYSREEVAKLIVICLLKKVLSIDETSRYLMAVTVTRPFGEAYDIFCAKLETNIRQAFVGDYVPDDGAFYPNASDSVTEPAIAALVCKLLVQSLLSTPEIEADEPVSLRKKSK